MTNNGSSGDAAAILVEGLTMRFGDATVVSGVDFRVNAGEVVGYLGPNGAGKSTTMRILAGLIAPSGGRVQLAGFDLEREPLAVKRRLGYLPETGALYASLSAHEHLLLLSDLYELDPITTRARIEALTERLGLGGLLNRKIDSLSKGQKQKVAVCTAFLHEPDILLLDEPLNGLDVESVRTLRDMIREVAARGGAVLYSSHILDVVERVCDRALILAEGRIVADAPTSELTARASDHRLETIFHQLVKSKDIDDLRGAFS